MKSIPFSSVREFYQRQRPEGHWFDADSIRFFKTKLPTVAYETQVGVLFITSEVNPSDAKRYSIRRQKIDGGIKTVGTFHVYHTSADALKDIKAMDKAGTTEIKAKE